MAQDPAYNETTSDKIKRILEDWDNANFFQKYFYGYDTQMEIPLEEIPAVIINPINTRFAQGPTGADLITERVDILVMINKKDYMDEQDDETISWKKKLELMVQGQDPTTQFWDNTTILGALRNKFTLENYIFNQEGSVDYGTTPKGVVDESTGTAWIRLTLMRHVTTPNKT